jgi:hypothetical protein
MLRGLRARLSFANVMATIAVFLSLAAGVAWALERNSVRSKHIVNEQVRKPDIADSALFSSGRVELVTDESTELYARGPFTLTAECSDLPPHARISVDTDTPHSSVSGEFTDPDYGPEESQPAIASAVSYNPDAVAEEFTATAPGGATVSGVAFAAVNTDPDPANVCVFALVIVG